MKNVSVVNRPVAYMSHSQCQTYQHHGSYDRPERELAELMNDLALGC